MAKQWEELGLTEKNVVDNMVGWLIDIEQNNTGISATLASYDYNRLHLGGIPAFSFLLAFPQLSSPIQTDDPTQPAPVQGAALLLRLTGSTALRQQVVKETLVQHYQSIPEPHRVIDPDNTDEIAYPFNLGLDPHTHNFLSFGGYVCQVLGSLYLKDKNNIAFGADIEYLPSACIYTVMMPPKDVLSKVIQIVKSSKPSSNENMMKKLGFETEGYKKESFSIGTLRYSATQNLQKQTSHEMPEIRYNFDEIIAQRTAVFGMTRTGKSNMIKNLISQLHIGAAEKGIRLGQLVFDINGEYANINEQDAGSLADAFGEHAIRFAQGAKQRKKHNVLELLPDFYNDLQLGLTLIQKTIREQGGASSESFVAFMNMKFYGSLGDDAALNYLRTYLYRTLLYKVGYSYDPIKKFDDFNINLFATENKSGLLKSDLESDLSFKPIKSFDVMITMIKNVIGAPKIFNDLHPEICALINLIRENTGQNGNGIRLTGLGYIGMCISQHCSNGDTTGVLKANELLHYVKEGRLVIIDLSGSPPSAQLMLMKELASKIFLDYLESFTNFDPTVPKNPPCLIYVEEAHNLLGKNVSGDDIWSRIAKEGSKSGLGLVYATQEPSAVEGNILSNTENFVVCHLNNSREVKEISQYFDFDVFTNSIIRLQEPGFIRLKQRDMPFVVPVQVHRFDVEEVKNRIAAIDASTLLPGFDTHTILSDKHNDAVNCNTVEDTGALIQHLTTDSSILNKPEDQEHNDSSENSLLKSSQHTNDIPSVQKSEPEKPKNRFQRSLRGRHGIQ